MQYNIVVWWDIDGLYIAKNLELGVVSQGYTIDEAVINIKEATDLFLEDEKCITLASSFRPAFLTTISR